MYYELWSSCHVPSYVTFPNIFCKLDLIVVMWNGSSYVCVKNDVISITRINPGVMLSWQPEISSLQQSKYKESLSQISVSYFIRNFQFACSLSLMKDAPDVQDATMLTPKRK